MRAMEVVGLGLVLTSSCWTCFTIHSATPALFEGGS